MTLIALPQIRSVGFGLQRPECVLAFRDGCIMVSDWRGGVSVIWRDGTQRLVRAKNLEIDLKPNGIGLLSDGTFLIAHLGQEKGGLYRLLPDGRCEAILTSIDGIPLPPCNYPHIDRFGRIWLTVSTRHIPRHLAYRNDIADGFIILITQHGARIVADGLGYTNECGVHPDGKRLFVNETFARRLSCYDIADNGDLSNKNTVTEFGHGTYPDGLTFDIDGGVWITSIISNRVICVTADGEHHLVIEDTDPEYLEQTEQAFLSNELNREHLNRSPGKFLKNISSLAFGGPDNKTAFMGNLLDQKIYTFHSKVKGYSPPYQNHALKIPAQVD